jgi:hypothetical protein
MTNSRVTEDHLPRACHKARERWQACRATADGILARQPTLSQIVEAYRRDHQVGARAELDFYRHLPSTHEALARAARAERPDGKRHDHQRRISKQAMREVGRRIPGLSTEEVRTFQELLERIETLIGAIEGVGELMVYDTSLRIGAKVGVQPDRVYLHAGTREGARALGLATDRGFLFVEELPLQLRRLKPREVEDLLCIYKSVLKRVNRASP